MKKVLITGATGFIGRNCLPSLKKSGFEIYAISSKPQENGSDGGVNWTQMDLLHNGIKELVDQIKPTHLLHLAWVTTPGQYWTSLDNLGWLTSSIDLLEAFATGGGKRAVMAGTCAEYDWNETEFSESKTLCRPRSLYGSSKLALHLLLESLAKQMGFSQAWGRIFYPYGPHEYTARFIPTIINGVLKKESIPCSHGNQIKDFLHVEDVANAFVSLLESEVQGAINIGSGEGLPLRKVIEQITDLLGGKEWIHFDAIPARKDEPTRLVADVTRLKRELQWKQKYNLEEGLCQTIAWWKKEIVNQR